LIDSDVKALQAIRQRIERVRILFPRRSSAIPSDQTPLLSDLAGEMHALKRLSRLLARPFGIRIIGYTDDTGPDTANLKLSQARAEAVRRFLIDNGKVTIAMIAVGMGSRSRPNGEVDNRLQASRRYAGFELVDAQGDDR
jgi:outer membrane protein OmpA-like peptidoglycan-associated protein